MNVTPLVVRAHRTHRITITPDADETPLPAEPCFASVVPAYDFWVIGKNEADTCPAIPCERDGDSLHLTYAFGGEQEYAIKIFCGDRSHPVLKTAVFALEDDLFEKKPVLSDFHIHTTCSDGKQSPAAVAAAYCRAGFEAIAITDHFTMEGSRQARAAYEGLDLPLALYYGEEVHTCQKNHLVHFGANESINEWYQAAEECTRLTVRALASRMEVPDGVERYEAAALTVLSERLHQTGGLSVFAHPFWRSNAYHLDPPTARWALSSQLFDAFELLGGHGVHENSMQIALWTDLLREGVHMPVLGCSDSHTVLNGKDFNNMKTLVFAADNSFPAIKRAILDEQTVAIYQYPGEEPRIFGSQRLVAYAGFLLSYYHPGLRRAMAAAADLMEAHQAHPVSPAEFTEACKTVNAYVSDRIRQITP